MPICGVFSDVSGPQWTTDGSNDLENGTSNDMNGKGGKKGNNINTRRDVSMVSGSWECLGGRGGGVV